MDAKEKQELLSSISAMAQAEKATAARAAASSEMRACTICGAHGPGVIMTGAYCRSCYERELKELMKEPSTPEQIRAAFKIWRFVVLVASLIFYLAWRHPL